MARRKIRLRNKYLVAEVIDETLRANIPAGTSFQLRGTIVRNAKEGVIESPEIEILGDVDEDAVELALKPFEHANVDDANTAADAAKQSQGVK